MQHVNTQYLRDTPNSWPVHVGLRVEVHAKPLNALEGVICESELKAVANIQPLDTLKNCEHCASQLAADKYVQAVNTLEVGKCGIRDSGLVAISHP